MQFKNISFPTDNSYSFNWIFSDSTKANGFSVKKVFDSIGSYNLKLQVTSPLGCFNEATFNNVVNVFPPPMADGNIDKTLLNIKNPVLRMGKTKHRIPSVDPGSLMVQNFILTKTSITLLPIPEFTTSG
ncbi:MAG: hypothetical protein IPG87_16035 [Saprospiraceae bacterium]|nr:hypothetical protein [Candidatus Vicinibacter affinis]